MGELYLVGIGPGRKDAISPEAWKALTHADVLCGYSTYIDLIKKFFPDKELYTTPMTKEMELCRWAVEQAGRGRCVAMVCSGDAGVYGMAGPVLELCQDRPDVQVTVIPGITAALAGAAVLGAPLMNDFCVISLSDRLTRWGVIERRLIAAALGDFVICLYNPSSKTRKDHLQKACDTLLIYRRPDTVCGWVRNIGRSQEEKKLMSLQELRSEEVDMFTTVYIGNRETGRMGEWMVTPRGYEKKT